MCYLNEDYDERIAECKRILTSGGGLLISERTWEGAVLFRLLYGGVAEMCKIQNIRDLFQGPENNLIRSRTFTEDEIVECVENAGFTALERKGISLFSLVCGYLRGVGKIGSEDEQYLPEVQKLMVMLGQVGKAHRSHVVVAKR